MSDIPRYTVITIDGHLHLVPEGVDYRTVEDWFTLPRLKGRLVVLADDHVAAVAAARITGYEEGVADEKARANH